ncbi:CpaE family protein [Pusillimonas sp.]|uniref:CpaE family protein n=1 Tax=Pusillimonas sp. TaxID=3040095 RepID=UPI0037C6134B
MNLLRTKVREDELNAPFLAFLRDAASEEEVSRFMKVGALGAAHVGRGGVDAAIAHMVKADRSPQRLLVDISGVDGPLDELDRLADACEPSVQVYVVGDRNDVGLYRNLLQRGVVDYLVKPLSVELLRRSLGDGSNRGVRQTRQGKIIAVCGTRGGVGTSSVAAHLARELSARGGRRRVVYIDLDLYGSSGPGLLALAGGNALVDVLGNVNRLDPQYLERTLATQDGRLFVLASELNYSEEFTPESGALTEFLGILGQHFHYVVLDVPQRGGALSTAAFANANLACVLTDQSIYSARTLVRLVRHIESGLSRPTVYTVINQPQPPVRGSVASKDFLAAVEVPIALTIPYDGRALALAENLGEPLVERSEFARAVGTLASLLSGGGVAISRAGLLGRLRKVAS